MNEVLEGIRQEIQSALEGILGHEDENVRKAATTVWTKASDLVMAARTAIEDAGKNAEAAIAEAVANHTPAAPAAPVPARSIDEIMTQENVSRGEAAGIQQRETPADAA